MEKAEKKKGLSEVVRILMDRDDLTEDEAMDVIDECRSELWDAIYGTSLLTPEEVIEEELGLEPDYIFEILNL